MDHPAVEHSDSDSGDSWTLIENSADTPEPEQLGESPSAFIENQEKDEDTDGISIISDSEPDSPTPCEIINETPEENNEPPPECETTPLISVDNNPQLNNMQYDNEAFEEEHTLLNDNIRKINNIIYVYSHNKKLNTLLNYVLLTSIVISVGFAIGHMWTVKSDCSLHQIPGVNKVLSRLYRLQEENAYLRSKLKDITELYNHQANNKVSLKQNKCRKVFEEPLHNDSTEKLTMCVDGRIGNIHKPNEKDVQDTMNLKSDVQNKGSISEKTAKNLKQVHKYHKNMKSPPYTYFENSTKPKYTPETLKHSDNEKAADHSDSRITYSDSLKSSGGKSNNGEFDAQYDISDLPSYNEGKVNENKKQRSKNYGADDDLHFDNEDVKKFNKKDYHKVFAMKEEINKKMGPNYDVETDSVFDDFLKKDNRYTGPKQKKEKKNDRKKLHKREKKRNKYEKIEMKDGLMKDYDDISVVSSQNNAFAVKEQNMNSGAGENLNSPSNNEIEITSDTLDDDDDDNKSTGRYVKNLNYKSARELNWYENRANMRKEARKRMEEELFHEIPPNANWYLKRMHKRDQCRAKGENCSYRKLAKQFKNYKTKT